MSRHRKKTNKRKKKQQTGQKDISSDRQPSSTSLVGFVLEHQNTCQEAQTALDELLSKFNHSLPPSAGRACTTSPHFSDIYQSKQADIFLAKLVCYLVEESTEELAEELVILQLLDMYHEVRAITDDYDIPQSFINTHQDQANFAAFGFRKAILFDLFNQGNSANRTCYSAIILRQLLQESVATHIKKYEDKDQFVLELSVTSHDDDELQANNKRYTYDPLLNPEVLFESSDYENNILPLYKNQPKHDLYEDFEVTAAFCNRYQQTIQPYFTAQIARWCLEELALNVSPDSIDTTIFTTAGITSTSGKGEFLQRAKQYMIVQLRRTLRQLADIPVEYIQLSTLHCTIMPAPTNKRPPIEEIVGNEDHPYWNPD